LLLSIRIDLFVPNARFLRPGALNAVTG
jgi:hypothetical protein